MCPKTEEEADAVSSGDVVIEGEALLSDFDDGNLEVVLREEIPDPVPDDISGFNWWRSLRPGFSSNADADDFNRKPDPGPV